MKKTFLKNIVGVDTHRDTLACYCNGKFKEFKTNEQGFKDAVKWANSDVWAIEGAYCFGQAFSIFLSKNGNKVYDINPLLTKSWRAALKISAPKNDYGDAKVISLFANIKNMEEVSFKTIKLKELLTTRKLFVKQKTQITNAIKMLYYTRGEKLPFTTFDTQKAIRYFKECSDTTIRLNANILEAIMNSLKDLEKEIEKEAPEKANNLTKIQGISIIRACTIYSETKGKLLGKDQFASYCGVAPIDCSSGKTERKRNNRGGNRILNSVFYSLSIAQIRYNQISKAYYEKKLQEGKTPRHARKCLARQLCNVIYNILKSNEAQGKP